MQFLKKVKSKKVISIVLAFIVSFCTIFAKPTKTYAESNNNTRIEMTNQRKVIDVKRNVGASTNITINGKTYRARKMDVKSTAYTSNEGGSLTFTGDRCKWGVIAVDPKVIPLHSKVYIPEFNMIFEALDTGSAIKNNKVDIFMNSYQQAINWGIRPITIYILE